MLGSVKDMLNSPIGYDDELASKYQSATSSCSKAGYAYTSPAAYALGPTPTSNVTLPTTSCSSTYTVQKYDTCEMIAGDHGVSSYSIISANNLQADCGNLAANSTLCLVDPCTTYTIQSGDTCDSILTSVGNGVTGTQLLAWNPNINPLCANIRPGMVICMR
jgi:LysM repeat protein